MKKSRRDFCRAELAEKVFSTVRPTLFVMIRAGSPFRQSSTNFALRRTRSEIRDLAATAPTNFICSSHFFRLTIWRQHGISLLERSPRHTTFDDLPYGALYIRASNENVRISLNVTRAKSGCCGLRTILLSSLTITDGTRMPSCVRAANH